jgi:hypothetical protein
LPRLEDWRRAAQSLERAQRLGDDDAVRARLLCAQAHVHRIRAQERRGGGAEEDWNDAIFGFEQAAELAPKWPDPYLGLARIYAYERFDLEGLLDALEAARARGYAWGPREVAQLADAYRRRGEELAAESRSASDVRSASRMLGQARLHLEAAVSAYDRILDFGNARRNRELAIATLDGLRRPEKRRIAGQR